MVREHEAAPRSTSEINMASTRFENDIREIISSAQSVLSGFRDTIMSHADKDGGGHEFVIVLHRLYELLQSEDFERIIRKNDYKSIQPLRSLLNDLRSQLPNGVDHPPRGVTHGHLINLRDLGVTLETLSRTEQLTPDETYRFRSNAVALVRAIEDCMGDATEGSVRSRRRLLGEAQNDAELLRAQLTTSRTELEIQAERAKAAELRTARLVAQAVQLESKLSELTEKVATYEGTESTLDDLIKKAHEQQSEIAKVRDDVQTLAADAADNVMASNYGGMARNHAKKERFFRWAALSFFTVSSIGAALIAWNVGWFSSEVDADSQLGLWTSMAKKLLVAGGLAAIGFYFARLSSHHRKIEVWSSSLGVQLKTLESYLGGIKDEDLKDSIREKFASLTFGGPPHLESSKISSSDRHALSEMATTITSALKT